MPWIDSCIQLQDHYNYEPKLAKICTLIHATAGLITSMIKVPIT